MSDASHLFYSGQTYPMTADDLNLGLFNAATNQCLGAFFDLTLSSGSAAVISWVIGGAFLKNVYSSVFPLRLVYAH